MFYQVRSLVYDESKGKKMSVPVLLNLNQIDFITISKLDREIECVVARTASGSVISLDPRKHSLRDVVRNIGSATNLILFGDQDSFEVESYD